MKTKNILITLVLSIFSINLSIGQMRFWDNTLSIKHSVSTDSRLIKENYFMIQSLLRSKNKMEVVKYKLIHCEADNEKYNNYGVYLAINPENRNCPMTKIAIKYFEESLLEQITPEASYNNSIVLTKAGKYDYAEFSLNNCLKFSLSACMGKMILYNKGIIESLNDDYYSAISSFTELIDTGYRKNDCYYNRGLAYAEVDSLEKAVKDFKKASRLFGSKGSRGMGYVSYKLNKNEKALNFYKKASFLNENATDDLNIGNLELAEKKYNKAEKRFTKLIKNEEYVNESFYGKGIVNYYKNEKRKALKYFDIALNRNAAFPDAYIGRAYVEIFNGEYNDAIIDLKHSLNIQTWNLEAYKGLGVANYFSENYTAALNDFETCRAIDSTYEYEFETYIIMSRVYPVDTAIKILQKALSVERENTQAYAEIGNLYFKLENYGMAIENYTKAIDKNKKYKECYVNRGNAYYRNYDYEKAIDDFKSALKLDTTDLNIYNGLGLAYSKTDKFAEALECYKKAVRLNPGIAEIFNNISLAYSQLGMYLNAQNNTDSAMIVFPLAHDTLAYAHSIGLNEIMFFNNNGLIFKEEKEYDKAISEFDKMPFYACLNNRGITKALKGQYKDAITDFDSAFTSMDSTRFEPIQNRKIAARNGSIIIEHNKEVQYNYGEFRKNKYQADEYIALYYYDSYNETLPLQNYFLRKTFELKSPGFSSITENYLIFDTDKYKYKTADKVKFNPTQKKNRKKMKIEKCVKG